MVKAAERIRRALKINPPAVKRKLVKFIKRRVRAAKAEGAVLGMSGGMDSSTVACLCTVALGPERVLGVSMPEAGVTDPHDVADTRGMAAKLGIRFRIVDITPAIIGMRKNITDFKVGALIPAANMKPRIRMAILYYYANLHNRLVVGPSNRSELRAGYFCYDAKTRAFTTNGLKDYTQLKPGDIVFTLNRKTGRIEERPIAGVYRFDYKGDLIHFASKRMDLMVTPNHRMLICKRDGSLVFKVADECFGRRIYLPVAGQWEGKAIPPPFIDLNTFYNQSQLPWNAKRIGPLPTHEFLYLLGIFIGDGTAYQGSTRMLVKTDLGQHHHVMYRDEKGRFINYPDLNPSWRKYDTHEIYFATPVGDPTRRLLEQILMRHKIRYSSTSNVVRIHSRALYETFRTCGHGARHKRIPRWVLQYPARELERLFRGLMDSDGSKKRGVYYTSSYQLALDFVEICIKTGRYPMMRVRPPRKSEYRGKSICSGVAYEISFPQKKILRTSIYPANIKKVHYEGTVWCPDVPETHNLLVERNGKFAFCGNTKFGDGAADLLPLGCLYKTQVKQLAGHLGVPKRIIQKTPSAGLWRGQTDESELGLTYDKLDMIYAGLDLGLEPSVIAEAAGVREAEVKRFIRREKLAAHKLRAPEIPKL